jgi:hypothetical protein
MRIAWRDKIVGLDITYNQALLFAFTLLEAQLGIILASIPVMQPIIRKVTHTGPLGKLRSIFTASKGTTAARTSEHPRTIGSKDSRIKLRKLGSDTDSILGDEGFGHGIIAERGTAENDEHDSRPHDGRAIHVSHSWEVRH